MEGSPVKDVGHVGEDTQSSIIVGGAGDRGCHYWISAASFSLQSQSATSACGQRDGRREKRSEDCRGAQTLAEGKVQAVEPAVQNVVFGAFR